MSILILTNSKIGSYANFCNARILGVHGFLLISHPMFLWFADSIFPNNWISCHETGEVLIVQIKNFEPVFHIILKPSHKSD